MINGRQRCIEHVTKAVCEDRNRQYGNPEDNFADIAALWNTYMGDRLAQGQAFNPRDVALMIVLTKVARARVSPEVLDHYIDIAGYAACGYACAEQTDAPSEVKLRCPACASANVMRNERKPNVYECIHCGFRDVKGKF